MEFRGFNGRPPAPASLNAPLSFGTTTSASPNSGFSFGASSTALPNAQFSFGTIARPNAQFSFGTALPVSENASFSFGIAPRGSTNAQFSFGTKPSNPSPPKNNFQEKHRFSSGNQSQQPPEQKRQVSPHAQSPGISPPRMVDQRKPPSHYSELPPQEKFNMVNYSDIYGAVEEASKEHSYPRAIKRDKSPRGPSAVVFGSSSVQLGSERSGISPPRVVDYSDNYDAGEDASTKHGYSRAPKRDRPSHPPCAVTLGSSSLQLDSERPDKFPHRMADQRKSPVHHSNPPPQERSKMVDYSDVYDAGGDAAIKHVNFRAPKRDRSPHPPSTDVSGSTFIHLDSEREMQAKARRLARFNVELSQPSENLPSAKHKTSESNLNQPSLDKLDIAKPMDARGSSNRDNLTEIESLESSQLVVGLCPDMCPEPERDERERKGDLDRYERLDGDRNQTSKSLAVKKYNRTAEREAELIRPMPVLQKTVDYLLTLLNQPYNEDFLNIYNFLWDRMRAIRMDLRMQHIFNQQAILMLEQMIRFHIVAMHELCEYNKGEGFAEGFDAHLNIEQMNKTSVELFQMYDDHRKKGIVVPTEKEFRGYYALLKLDKHPGYKVEPAELSLDLAKMTPEIRSSPEILFARDVARACRIGNYIAFFRLARKATYLQACLMHAHFAKLRTQALASLHSSLQNNQGMPVTGVISWLGLEEEDVESLLEYHGFILKKFEEIYMVKEGPFLNSNTDFPTKRSHLVQLKKSQMIFNDIYSGPTISDVTEIRKTASDGDTEFPMEHLQQTVSKGLDTVDQIALASEADTRRTASPSQDVIHSDKVNNRNTIIGAITQPRKFLDEQTLPLNRETEAQPAELFLPCDTILADHAVSNCVQQDEDDQIVESEEDASLDQEVFPNPEVNIVRDVEPISSSVNNAISSSASYIDIDRELENKEQSLVLYGSSQVAEEEKLKLILRKWKQQATKRRETREQRIMLASQALSSLSTGPPFHQCRFSSRLADSELNIANIARERHRKQAKSWSTINVSEVVAPVLSSKNPDVKCLCWKLLLVGQPSLKNGKGSCLTLKWLLSKMMGSSYDSDKPIVSVPHLSIWRSWINSQLHPFYKCCLSIIREATFDGTDLISEDDAVTGTSSIMFHVSESVPWDVQRVRLHNVLARIPSGSSLPLLIVSGDTYTEEIFNPSLTITRRLGLDDVDMTRISSFSVIFLCENPNSLLKDDEVREGLLWLAEHSPRQPTVCLLKTRDVVMDYLISSEEVLENDDAASDHGPNYFISIFNAALDRLADEIVRTASLNANHWPSPEIYLLEKSSDERALADKFLPSVGWSSPLRIEPVVKAIKGCKLPEFSNDISWLKEGSYMGLKIIDQKLGLEKSLMRYLTQSCQMLKSELAAREAGIMVQTGACLELHGSYYYIVPRWSIIFRRIQNWRLVNLTAGICSVAYLLEQHQDRLSAAADRVQGYDVATPLKSITMTQLDKIVEISCNIPLTEQPPISLQPSSSILSSHIHEGSDATKTYNLAENSEADLKCSGLLSTREDGGLAIPSYKMDDRLSLLLEKCSRLQDMIDEKLAIYF
ncbi:SAC3 family protein B isoform X1 [Canna indica]|uniref:SAC3 family protein B isoform X1 n=1 Tax=Canna indica TaxID=4628 RepID=A0AAQ3KH45_9LILI|nr:SAC3 family protein B isoform X1 [Canna indica]